MIGVNESTIKGYPHASISSKGAFEWTLKKIIRSNTSGFKLHFLHVQVPDEDGTLSQTDIEISMFFLLVVYVNLCVCVRKLGAYIHVCEVRIEYLGF